MRDLFGTDGLRGAAGRPPLDGATLEKLGRALVRAIAERHGVTEPRICLGSDTRESCAEILAHLARGILSSSGHPVGVGVLPTPALALLTREGGFDSGLMISASHNPFHDNGVKVFGANGSKLPDSDEAALERLMESDREDGGPVSGELEDGAALRVRYLSFLEACLEGGRLDGLKVVLDTAHGAATVLAPEAFRRAGAVVTTLGDEPNGRNINDGVGSMHPEVVAGIVRESGADIGFAFDGDADRCLASTAQGQIVDGDAILFCLGRALSRADRLPEAKIVATVMSNLGLEKALEAEGIGLLRASVGDRYVLQSMIENDCRLGGEQSGHVILRDYAPTGDGILTALTLARLVAEGSERLDEVVGKIPRFPQVLLNLRVAAKPDIASHAVLSAAVKSAERELGSDGRLVVRYSGTEPKVRVMVEGTDRSKVERVAKELIETFRDEVGAPA